MNVSKSLLPDSKGTYQWNVGRHGNVSALSEEGNGVSLDDCVLKAHRAIADNIREVEEVRSYILEYVGERKPVSRYERDPVI
jgi:NurA-like 5'-3' nuclease